MENNNNNQNFKVNIFKTKRINKRKLFNKLLGRKVLIVFSIMLIGISICMPRYYSKASNNISYELPEYVRIGLTTYYSNKSVLYINNKSISIGYNVNNFTDEVTFNCAKAFRVENNTSDRLISKNTFNDYEEVLDIIDGNNDLLPVMVSKGKWKVATKPNRQYNEIDMEDYKSDSTSIVLINGDNKEIMIFSGKEFPIIKSNDNEDVPVIKFPERHYRGYIQIIREVNMTAINHVKVDEYLYSVLASEMSSSWPLEALKAQAVTARTFALKKIYAERFKYYDLVDSTNDQVYKGFTLEGPSTIKASDDTSKMVLIYTGDNERYYNKLVDTFYYSCSGGVTEEPQNVWNSSLPYFKSKKDIYEDKNKYYNWEINFSISDLQKAVDKAGKSIGVVTGCTVTLAKESGRVLHFNIIGTKSTYTVSKDSIRTFFTNYMGKSLNSTNFELYSGNNPTFSEKVEPKKIAIINAEGTVTYKLKEDISLLNVDVIISSIGKKLHLQINPMSDEKTIFNFETTTYTNENPKQLNKNEYLIIGSGWGHGVGMSQYGAKNMAEKNFDYEEILTFYYDDTEVITLD